MGGVVVWFTGLHRAGKSTLARAAKARLGARAVLLDEDELHAALDVVPREGDGDAFYGTVARLAALLARQGFVVLVAARTEHRPHRHAARAAAPRFIEVHVATPPEATPGRTAHGLWFSSESHEDDGPWDPPLYADVIARGGHDELALERLLAAIDGGPVLQIL